MAVVHFKDEYERAALLAATSNGTESEGVQTLDFSEAIECAYCKKEESKVVFLTSNCVF